NSNAASILAQVRGQNSRVLEAREAYCNVGRAAADVLDSRDAAGFVLDDINECLADDESGRHQVSQSSSSSSGTPLTVEPPGPAPDPGADPPRVSDCTASTVTAPAASRPTVTASSSVHRGRPSKKVSVHAEAAGCAVSCSAIAS